jgi:hypothetical protein
MPEVPARVTAPASVRGFGPPLAYGSNGNPPLRFFLVSLVGWGVCVAFFFLFGPPFTTFPVPARIVFMTALGVAVGGPPFFLASLLIQGVQQQFLYRPGLICVRNGRVRVVPWEDVRELRTLTTPQGTPAAYQIRTRTGRRIGIAPEVAAGPESLEILLRRFTVAAGIPETARTGWWTFHR